MLVFHNYQLTVVLIDYLSHRGTEHELNLKNGNSNNT